ncbi:MAG: hypothetical protein SWK76_07480 [Actinomycetota bacterium]|nr:hypothetical protein [Actinomycetota bacterium]
MRRMTPVLLLVFLLLLPACMCACGEKSGSGADYGNYDVNHPDFQQGEKAGDINGYDQGRLDAYNGLDYNSTPPGSDKVHSDSYNAGYAYGYRDGYMRGFNEVDLSKGQVTDVPSDTSVGGESRKEWWEGDDEDQDGEGAKTVLDDLDGFYQCDAGFDPHYTYSLYIQDNHTTYKMDMVPKGGYVVVFQEEGTCEVDAGGKNLTLTPKKLHEKRPDELPTCPTFRVEYDNNNGSYWIMLVDEDGKVWE